MSDLYDALVGLGVSRREVESAEQSGTLLALAAERFLLPGERKFDATEVAALCDVELETLTKLWLALGFPRGVEEKVFTDQDIEVLRTFPIARGSYTIRARGRVSRPRETTA
jgi:hypothetical protein